VAAQEQAADLVGAPDDEGERQDGAELADVSGAVPNTLLSAGR
jgi:hypothetical protein